MLTFAQNSVDDALFFASASASAAVQPDPLNADGFGAVPHCRQTHTPSGLDRLASTLASRSNRAEGAPVPSVLGTIDPVENDGSAGLAIECAPDAGPAST